LKSEEHGLKFAVIENEFGDVGVDDGVLKKSSEDQIIEMMNGCVCCTVRSDLVKVLKELAALPRRKKKAFDAVIIETTGLADPAPVAQTFFVDDDIAAAYRLDGIVAVVDAKHATQHLTEEKPEGVENEAVEQVAFADRILLNKVDLVDAKDLADVEQRLKAINSQAKIFHTTQAHVDPKLLLNIQAFSLDRVVAMDPEFLDTNGEHQHDENVTSLSFKFDGEVYVSRLEAFIEELLLTKATDLFRYKGFLAVKGMSRKFLFQGVHMLFQGTFDPEYEWNDKDTRECRFVFIGRDLDHDHLKNGFLQCRVDKDLRFNVGDTVYARVEDGFKKGKVLQLWDQGNPYRIRLDDVKKNQENEVWGPDDTDDYVKAAL